LVTFRVANGEVISPRPVDFQANIAQGIQHAFTVFDFTVLNFGSQVGMDGRLGLGSFVWPWHFAPAEEPGFVQVGVVRGI